MRRYGIIILALVVALGLGLTVTDVWSYLLDFCKLAAAYGVDLINAVFVALKDGVQNIMGGVSAVDGSEVVNKVVEVTTNFIQ